MDAGASSHYPGGILRTSSRDSSDNMFFRHGDALAGPTLFSRMSIAGAQGLSFSSDNSPRFVTFLAEAQSALPDTM
jgi:hypothetical protein